MRIVKAKQKSAYQIQIDELNNALIVAAPSAVVREIKNVVGKLDRARPQVLIEAVIAELSEDQAKRLIHSWCIPVKIAVVI